MEQVKEIMTENPTCCTPETSLQDVAKLMVEHDCGEIPVLNNMKDKKPVGVITDRDICCRTVAQGKNPLEMTAEECMSTPCITVKETDSIDDCCAVLEENQIRRVPVVDENGSCCGIVAQADLAHATKPKDLAGLVKNVSKPSSSASAITQQKFCQKLVGGVEMKMDNGEMNLDEKRFIEDPGAMMLEHPSMYSWVQPIIMIFAVWLMTSPLVFEYQSTALVISDVAAGMLAFAVATIALTVPRITLTTL